MIASMYMNHHFVDSKVPGHNEPLMFSWADIREALIMCITASKADMHGFLALDAAHPAMPQYSWLC